MRQCKYSFPVLALQLPATYCTTAQEIPLPQSSAGKLTNVLLWLARGALQNFSRLKNQQYLETLISHQKKNLKKKLYQGVFVPLATCLAIIIKAMSLKTTFYILQLIRLACKCRALQALQLIQLLAQKLMLGQINRSIV